MHTYHNRLHKQIKNFPEKTFPEKTFPEKSSGFPAPLGLVPEALPFGTECGSFPTGDLN
jgi:hypothetical protein